MAECPPTNRDEWCIDFAREVLIAEAEAIHQQISFLGEDFLQACRKILTTRGHVIVTGLGKSGHVGAKIAATLASTGTPAFFVHAAEAGHGDLGMIGADDCLLAISFSGECQEILTMMPIVQRIGVPVITLTGKESSAMAKAADISLIVHIEKEACPLGLAPTTSTTATLALGDALAITLMKARDFSEQDFARSHPYGRLGRRLIIKVSDLMRQGEALPVVTPQDSVETALFQITAKGLGATLVCENEQLKGIFTDGDLRRTLEKLPSALQVAMADVMTKTPKTISSNTLAAQALQKMEQWQITALPVVDDETVVGILHIHDLLRAGVG